MCSLPRTGHKTTGLSNSLDGAEDWKIGRDAATFWNALQMDEGRRRAMQEVDELLASGAITSFGDWQKVVRHPESTGIACLEGEELEGELLEGEKPWVTPEDEALIAADEADFFRKQQEPPADAAPEDAEASRLACSAVTRLARLKALRAQHALCQLPAAAGLVDSEIKQVSRGLQAGGREESQKANDKLRAYMDVVVAKEKELLAKRQAAAARQRVIVRKQAATNKTILRKKKAKAKAKAELKKKLDELPVAFRAEDCGTPGPPGQRARTACLERLKLRSPKLPFELEVNWVQVRNAYSTLPKLRATYKLKKLAPAGAEFINDINGVLRALREHYSAPTRYNKESAVGGDPMAFENWFRRAKEAVMPPKAATVAEM